MSRNQALSISPQFKNWLDEAITLEIDSETKNQDQKRQLYKKMGTYLLTTNTPKNQIYSLIHKLLQDSMRDKLSKPKYILNNSWLHDVCSGEGWTKSSLPNTSGSRIEKDKPEAFLRNQLLEFFEEMQIQISENMKILRSDLPKETWEKFFDKKDDVVKLFELLKGITITHFEDASRCKDSRQIILPTDRFYLMALKNFISDVWYCKQYHAVVKERSKITPRNLFNFLEDPYSFSKLISHCMLDPLNLHFLDIKCPTCKGYYLKTYWKMDGTWEILCTNEKAHEGKKKTFPAQMINEQLTLLVSRKDLATKFLTERAIRIPSDNAIKIKK